MQYPITILKRVVQSEDIEEIKKLIAEEGHLGRSHISRVLCVEWNWKNSRGLYQDISCRDLLRRLERRGIITLPGLLTGHRKVGYKNKVSPHHNITESPLSGSVENLKTIHIEMIQEKAENEIYKSLIGNYHYLGYHQGSGEQLRYLVYGSNQLLGCIGFQGASYKVGCRDEYIGWNKSQREKNLSMVINNGRFLLLPWVCVKNLASYVLGKMMKRINEDMEKRYGHKIALVETYVESNRFRGTCYQAANWKKIGQTKGRGRNDRQKQYGKPVKDVYVYEPDKQFRSVLSAGCLQDFARFPEQ
ncbi:MAG: DUF4338 domain-containing protein [Bacteroidetes bacterium]|nr:DUF4338 domain-containing protein [Bacteroidota bacterium]